MERIELKIGNYVEWGNDIACVEQILERDIIFKCGDIGLIDDIIPISITKDWLLKLKFNKFPGSNVLFDTDSFWVCELISNGCLYIKHLGITINYIHELQNIYYEFTKQKLKN